jgi:hypothetical protein
VIGAALALGAFTLFLTLALITHDGTDAAIHTAAGGSPSNWMGSAGAWFADLLLFVGGVAITLLLPLLGVIAWRLWTGEAQPYWKRQLAFAFIAVLLVGLGAQLWSPDSNAPLPAGWGGIIALIGGGAIDPLFDRVATAFDLAFHMVGIIVEIIDARGLTTPLTAPVVQSRYHRRDAFEQIAGDAERLLHPHRIAAVIENEGGARCGCHGTHIPQPEPCFNYRNTFARF